MNRLLLLVTIILAGFLTFEVQGQAVYFSVSGGGDWTSDNTWDLDGDGLDIGTDGIPGPTDIAIISGDGAGGGNVLLNSNQAVGDVYIQYDNPNVLSKGGFFLTPFTLTINGQLAGVDLFGGGGGFAEPVTTVLESNLTSRLGLVFTGANIGTTSFNPVITSWGTASPLKNVTFNGNTPSTEMHVDDFAVFGGSTLNVANGILTVNAGQSISQSSDANLAVASAAQMIVNGGINGDGTNTSRFGSVNFSGSVSTGISGYINASNFTLGATGTLDINFSGVNQTEGWWYQSFVPIGVFSINVASTVRYGASANQNIGATTYGNLTLSSPATASTKSLVSSNTLVVQGVLTINSANVTFHTTANANNISVGGSLINNGTWSPSQLVIFNGSASQIIDGNNTIVFDGGVRISNTVGANLTNVGMDVNGLFDIDPGCIFHPADQLVSVSGNMRVDGTLNAGTDPGGFIFDGTTIYQGGGIRNFNNVTISGNMTAPLGTLNINGDFINNGTFDNGGGTISFAGADAKLMDGSATSVFNNLNLTGGTLGVAGTAQLQNVMTISANTTFDADGAANGGLFTLLSTQSRDAAIAAIPATATFSGDVTIQRAIYNVDAQNEGYHIIGFPATGISVSELQDNLSITGTFTGRSTGTGFDNNPSLFAYIENTNSALTLQQRYVAFPPSSNTTTFPVGEGYHLFTYPGEAPVTLDGIGTLFTGNFTRNLTFTGVDPDAGWHTIANPYPAPTNWAAWGKTGVQANTAHVYNPATGAYLVYDGLTQQLIPQGQGFFVRAAPGGGQVTATETTKVTGSTPIFYREEAPLERFEIVLNTPEYDDIAIVRFVEGATDAYEWEFDATRLLNTFETLSTLSTDNVPLKVNGLANIQNNSACRRSIFLNLEQMKNNVDYQLEFRDLENVSNYQFILVDHYLNETIAVQTNTAVTLQVNDDASSKGAGRFELVLENNQPNQLSLVGGDVCPEQNAVLQIGTSQSNISYTIYKDSTLISSFSGTGAAQEIAIENSFLLLGDNEFDVYATNGACDSVKVGTEVFILLESLTYNNEVSGSMVCEQETFAPFEIQTQNEANYFILQNSDTLLSFVGNGAPYTGQIPTASLADGLNTLIVGVEKDACQSGTLEQNLEITIDALSIDETVSYFGNSTCDISKGKIIINTQDNITYDIFKGGQLVTSVNGTGEEVQTDINQNLLSEGVNEFKLVAKYGTCSSFEFAEMAQVTIDLLETPEIIVSGNLLESSVNADTYTWLLNGEVMPNETNKILVVTVAGNYALEINKGDCASSSNSVNISETILSTNDALTNVVNIYPNPVSEVLRISVEDVNEIKVTIFTVSGQFVNRYVLKGSENTIDVSRFGKGTYLIQLETDKGNITKRIVKK